MTEQEDRVEISYVSDEDTADEYNADAHETKIVEKKATIKKKHTVKQLQKELDEKKQQMDEALKERDEYKDKYIRNLAEMDNFRKRVKKEKEDYQRYVLAEFLLELLQVYDNLERALRAKVAEGIATDETSIVSGVEMIHKQFSDLLKKYNVVEIDALGRPFDPNVHQALSTEERETVKAPIIVEVYQKGFTYNGKLLKPTLAKVAVPMAKRTEKEPAAGDEAIEKEDE